MLEYCYKACEFRIKEQIVATHLRRDTVGWVRFFNEVKKRNPAKPRIRKMLGYVICASLDKLTQPTFLSPLKCVAQIVYQ